MIPFYAASVGSWIYLRHVLNLRILYSLLTEFRTVGPYELNWETQQYKCWISNIITFSLLASLQALNLFWLYFLLRSAFKFLTTGEKKDDRSESDMSAIEVETYDLRANGVKANGVNGHLNGNRSPNGTLKGASGAVPVKMNGFH
jgi:acyl-CoA-dependent ceramide synthase